MKKWLIPIMVVMVVVTISSALAKSEWTSPGYWYPWGDFIRTDYNVWINGNFTITGDVANITINNYNVTGNVTAENFFGNLMWDYIIDIPTFPLNLHKDNITGLDDSHLHNWDNITNIPIYPLQIHKDNITNLDNSHYHSWDNITDTTDIIGDTELENSFTWNLNDSGLNIDWTYLNHVNDFELDFDDWTNQAGDNCDWQRGTSTGSISTGPCDAGYCDHTKEGQAAGYFIFLETSSGYCSADGNYAVIESIYTDVTYVDYLTFWYSMYGNNCGNLILQIYNGGAWTQIWSDTGNKGVRDWFKARVDISAYKGSQAFRLLAYNSGGSYQGDIAVDDFILGGSTISSRWDIIAQDGYCYNGEYRTLDVSGGINANNLTTGTLTCTQVDTLTNTCVASSADLICTDCIGPTEITDSYLINNGNDSTSGSLTLGANQQLNIGGTDVYLQDANGNLNIKTTGGTIGLKSSSTIYLMSYGDESNYLYTYTNGGLTYLRSSGDIYLYPNGVQVMPSSTSVDLGDASLYFDDINYKDLYDRGCLIEDDKGISAIEIMKNIGTNKISETEAQQKITNNEFIDNKRYDSELILNAKVEKLKSSGIKTISEKGLTEEEIKEINVYQGYDIEDVKAVTLTAEEQPIDDIAKLFHSRRYRTIIEDGVTYYEELADSNSKENYPKLNYKTLPNYVYDNGTFITENDILDLAGNLLYRKGDLVQGQEGIEISGMVSFLLDITKEQQEQIDQQQVIINNLTTRITKLENAK